MIDTFEKLKNISLHFGLIVNENKTKNMKCTRKETQLDSLMVDNMQIDQVKSFSYLGTIVNGNNTLEEEIREVLLKGIKHSMQIKLFLKVIWCLVSRKSKLKLYWSVIRPVAVYGCETWVCIESVIQKLSVFERKIFGPTEEANGFGELKNTRSCEPFTMTHGSKVITMQKRCFWNIPFAPFLS